jgi:YVTN family beta-propeller protein
VIDMATNTVIITFPVNVAIPMGVAVTPNGSKVFVAGPDAVLAIDLLGGVTATVDIDASGGVAVTPDGRKVYVTIGDNTVQVIDTATNTVIGSPISVGKDPIAFGKFIQPLVSTFSDFRARLTMSSFRPSFALLADFALGRTSNGINPLSEAVTIGIGAFTTTVPPGSFKMTGPRTYSFIGVINGLTLKALIKLAGRKTYTFEAVPGQAAGLLVVPNFSTNAWQALAGSKLRVLLRRFWPMLAGICVGSTPGAGFLANDTSGRASMALGVMLVAYALMSMVSPRLSVPLSRTRGEVLAHPVSRRVNPIAACGGREQNPCPSRVLNQDK